GYLGIKARHYEAWKTEVVKIDTATDSIETSFAKLVEKLGI
ncbi:TPA: ATP-binding protein, partial [Vibrio harveyi]|nr:ATP-binding protein [Vibrio harveyi]